MAPIGLRFVHAAHLRLDAPLVGTGPLSRSARRVAEDATLTAWQRVVDACLERSADFLLLTGPLFGEGPTRRARKAFIDGSAALAEFGIDVFATDLKAGESVQAANLRLLAEGEPARWEAAQRTPVELHVIDRLLAVGAEHDAGAGAACSFRIACLSDADGVVSAADRQRGGFDYLAIPGVCTPSVTGGPLLPDPGVIQGLSAEESGPQGCVIVEVDADHRVDAASIITAPVRWERCRVEVDPHVDRRELVERMQRALLDREPAIGEQLWIVDWTLDGAPPLRESGGDDLDFATLCEEVESGVGKRRGGERVHRLLPSGEPALLAERRAGGNEASRLVVNWDQERPMLAERLRCGGFGAAADLLGYAEEQAVRTAAARHLSRWTGRDPDRGGER